MSAPTLNIRCPSWSHLENFYSQKVKDGNILLARVPFTPTKGSPITISLDLPDGLKILIPGEVEAIKQAPDGRKSAIKMVLQGLDGAMRARLQKAVQDGLAADGRSPVTSERRPQGTRTEDGLPLPIPADVPIDELVPVSILPAAADVPEESRAQYEELQETLRALREKAAHDVLGVDWDADVATVRLAYFKLIKQYHPDVLARHESAEIALLASELFIYINKAYDRLRDSAVAAGKAIAAGPALLPHDGWLADFDDLGPLPSDANTLRPLRWAESVATPGSEKKKAAKAAASMPTASMPAASTPTASPTPSPKSTASPTPSPKPTASPTPSPSRLDEEGLFSDARITQTSAKPLRDDVVEDPKSEETLAEIDVDAMLDEGRELLEAKDFETARELLAKLLESHPRNRNARALYHVSYGHTLLTREQPAEALTQFEVALKHDPDCPEAKSARAAATTTRRRRPSLFNRILRR